MLGLNGFDCLDVLGLEVIEVLRVVVPPSAVVPELLATPVLPGEVDAGVPAIAVPVPVARAVWLPDASVPLPGPEEPFLRCYPPSKSRFEIFEMAFPLSGVREDVKAGVARVLRSRPLLRHPCIELCLLGIKA